MNKELMEKIAANSDAEADVMREIILSKPIDNNPDYPYGNKLGKKYVAKKALKGALVGGGHGAAIGGLFSTPVWLDNYPSFSTKDKLKYSGAFTGIGAGIGVLTGGILSAREASANRPMSYLPSKDQKSIRSNYIKADTAVAKAEKKYDDAMDAVERFWEDPNLDDNNRAYIKAYDKKYDTQERLHDAFSTRDKAEKDYFDAYSRGKALMLEEKKNRRLSKKASIDYDEMVKLAYEDILGGFEKSAEENTEEAKREQKKEMMKRLAATSALTAGATLGGVALYKKISDSSNCYPKIKKFRGNIEKVTKGKPVVKLRNDEWEVAGSNTSPIKLLPLLSAGN